MLNKTEAAQLMIDDLPCRESLGADDVDYSALITAWNKKNKKNKHGGSSASRAVRCGQWGSLFRSFFLFFFLSTNVGQKLHLSPALWHKSLHCALCRPVQAEGTVSLQCADGNAIVGSHLWIPEGRGWEVVCLQIIFNN